jgi:hypothetical protein
MKWLQFGGHPYRGLAFSKKNAYPAAQRALAPTATYLEPPVSPPSMVAGRELGNPQPARYKFIVEVMQGTLREGFYR